MSASKQRQNGRAAASGARAKPYARPSAGNGAAIQLNIRGSSGPSWIIVSNVVRGTTEADLREILLQFGGIEDVRLIRQASASERALTFEVAFTHASSAQGAIDKLDGILADGQILVVRKRESRAAVVTPTIERGNALGRALAPEKARTQPPKAPLRASTGPASSSLQSRILSPAELKSLTRRQQHAERAPPGPNQPSASSLALAKRIGSRPLAMRLGESTVTPGAGGQSTKRKKAGPAPTTKRDRRTGATAGKMNLD